MIIINFKNYLIGEAALKRAKLIEKYLPDAIVAVSALDTREIFEKTKLKVFAQHIDVVSSPTLSTGFISAGILKKSGMRGSLINHSEHQISHSLIWSALNDLEENKMKGIVCVPTISEAMKLVKLKPWAMAFEDVELIATGKSITNYKKNEIEKFVSLLKGTKIIPICGAGIHSANDVRSAYDLGCKGGLIASAIVGVSLRRAEKLLKAISKV